MRWRQLGLILALGLGLTGCVPPIVLSPPTISGDAQVGATLTVNPGQWVLSGTITYQWQRCDVDPVVCTDIPGETGSNYVSDAPDMDKHVRARVTNSNSFGAQTAFTSLIEIAGPTRRVSVASDGTESTLDSYSLSPDSISHTGRFVVFESWAGDLVTGDTNGQPDVFLHDTATGITTRVSVSSDGTQGNDWSSTPAISANGRHVAFLSMASNLVPDDSNGGLDAFVHDTATGTTSRVSVATDGSQGNPGFAWYGTGDPTVSLSADGRYVAFQSDASNLVTDDNNSMLDVFVHDTATGTTTRVSVADDGSDTDGSSLQPSISDDGRYVAFMSDASNVVPFDSDSQFDIYVRDTQVGTSIRTSLTGDGSEVFGWSGYPSISGDGRYVVFESEATDLVPNDTNDEVDIFLHDTLMGSTTRINVDDNGMQAESPSWPLNGGSFRPSISGDGRYVAFESYASNLVGSDTNDFKDVFRRDTQAGTTTRVSIAMDGSEADLESHRPSISGDGDFVSYTSEATNLIPDDMNSRTDVFVSRRGG